MSFVARLPRAGTANSVASRQQRIGGCYMEIFVAGIGFLLVGVLVISFFVQRASTRRGKTPFLDTGQHQHKRNTKMLWGMILLAISYSSLLRHLHTLTGTPMLDGYIGVALGLYICSHPAANAVNMLFFERAALRQLSSEWSGVRWLALNLLVLVTGWMVIYIGITRLVDRAA